MSLVVKPLEETQFTFEQYYDFIQQAYAERVDQGIPFVCTTLSVEGLKQDIVSNCVHIYVGLLEDDPIEIAASIGMACRHNRDGNYAWFHLVATNNKIKGKGVGSMMLKRMIEIAKEKNCEFVSLSTAKNAISAVRFYLKNGFFICADSRSLLGNGYDSYGFHYQIKHPSKWDNKTYRQYRLFLSDLKQVVKIVVAPFYKLLMRK